MNTCCALGILKLVSRHLEMPMSLSKPSMLGLNLDIIMETIARLAASDAVSLLKVSALRSCPPVLFNFIPDFPGSVL